MNREEDHEASKPQPQRSQPAGRPDAEREVRAGGGEDLLEVLQRMEQVLAETRVLIESTARERRHRDFSLAWMIGALIQAAVVGFVVYALLGWVQEAPAADQLVKLAFAGVLQLSALTAFVLAGNRS